MERRRHNRRVGESTLTLPTKRTSIFFFEGMDTHFTPMVKAPGYVEKRFPRALFQGIITR